MTVDVENQRPAVQRAAENTATYTYDLIGRVVGDAASEGTSNRLNEQLHYGFEPAGNPNYRMNNTNGGRLTVMGTATSPATLVAKSTESQL
jgi:hypothetical protein